MLSGQGVIRYILGLYASDSGVVGPLLRAVPLNATTRQVLGLTRAAQTEYLQGLWKNNQENHGFNSSGTVYSPKQVAGLFRRFNQLPCTVATRKARAELFQGFDKSRARVLILGDDDMLSVELCQRGFKHVTVADCDENLLNQIRQETATLATRPEILQADFRLLPELGITADVVVLDPPYSLDGATAFLTLAARLAKPGATLFMMVNPHILGPTFKDLSALAARLGLRLVTRREGFNAYPIGQISRLIMRLAWWHYMGVPLRRTRDRDVYFFSDCFEFRNESNQ